MKLPERKGEKMNGKMNKMMKQAQKMQSQMAKMQEEVSKKTVEATSGGGAVKVVANGRKELVDLEIDQEVLNEDEVEIVQDLIISAVNEAMKKVDTMMEEEMKKVTGGLDLPPGLF